MTFLREIEWEAPLIEPYRDPDAEALMRKKYGFVMDSAAFYSRSPWIVRSQVRFDIQRDVLVHVDVDLAEIIGLVVSQDNSCRFCYAAWRALLRLQGYSQSRIERLEENCCGVVSFRSDGRRLRPPRLARQPDTVAGGMEAARGRRDRAGRDQGAGVPRRVERLLQPAA